jgi:hypothetical protein
MNVIEDPKPAVVKKRRARKPRSEPRESKKTEGAIARDARGRFLKGVSGNPGGQHVLTADVRDAARQHGIEAIERLVYWMRSGDSQSSIAAAKILLDRGYGKALQVIGSPNGAPLVSIALGAAPRTAEELQAVYTQFMANPELDVSSLRLLSAPGTETSGQPK